ncbi:MAG: hypothetical protein KC620_16255 [Myxococcales bacterium]|nr:hypothetical protein [Myxococcales bacterium]
MTRALALLLTLLCAAPAWADASAFWKAWSDGKAELSGYTLVQPRYGELRQGHAVLIFVTEPFSRSRGVKVDRYDPNDPDQFTALKLNHVRKFQTGIYDYSLLTSVFVDPARDMAPVKISFSAQEWCGHVYEEARFSPDGGKVRFDSYFEGETGQTELRGAFVPVDALLIQARGLLANGPMSVQSKPTELLGAAMTRRLKHLPAALYRAQLTRGAPRPVEVPAGRFVVAPVSWTRPDGVACAIDVEVAAPHRIIGWACQDGEQAKLTGSMRLPYWQTHGEGDEKLLKDLGLPAPPGRSATPAK